MNSSNTPQAFVSRWRGSGLTERASAQSHFIDLCRLLDVAAPTDEDRTGDSYSFEKGAQMRGGGQGWADVWKRGHFAWEYKGPGRDLERAYDQLLRYREALENPPLLVVSDIETIQLHTNFTNSRKVVHTWMLDDLLDPAQLERLRWLWTKPEKFRSRQTTEAITEEAARNFATLADLLRQAGHNPERAARFLIRLLFCLFAEDVRLLPEGLFTRLLSATRNDPAAFTAQLRQLFGTMSRGGYFGVDRIPTINGGLFDDDDVLPLPHEALGLLQAVARLDWAAIEPAIFGTLFERSLDPAKRAQLGAHYTARADILLIVEPVLMAPLRRRWEEVRHAAQGKIDERQAMDDSRSIQMSQHDRDVNTRKRKSLTDEIVALLRDFVNEIVAVRVLDPACGSGNFLYVALQQLHNLEKEVIQFAADSASVRFFPEVGPQQVHGIEINEYAHELAQTTIWIGHIQWLRDNGYGTPSEPILKPIQTIHQMDAILDYDEAGNPVEPAWPPADVIIGNPPFLGDRKMRRELGDRYVDDIRDLYNRLPSSSDLVTYWFERARALIEQGEVERAGLLATQAIRGGSNRVVLERIKETGDIFWAEADRNWILNGANVHVSMVGFDGGDESRRVLDGEPANVINPDLTSSVADLTLAEKLIENFNLSFIGTQKSGPFDLSDEQAQEMLSMTGNPNGAPNSDVIKPWINATDITQHPRGMWIIDFGTNMALDEAAQYEAPFEYVHKNVKPKRDVVKRKSHRERWWRFGDARPGMRDAINSLSRFIVTPMVSKHRVFDWIDTDVIPENLLVVIARDDDYFFGVLHSKVHELWSRAQGTQLRDATSGTRYTPTSTFETFPFPWPPGDEPTEDGRVVAIAEAVRDLVETRDRWLNPDGASASTLKKRTLTNLYNQRPTWLHLAHQRLDDAVLSAYGWPRELSVEEILERLLALNLQRAAASR